MPAANTDNNDFVDCGGWVLCKLWDACGICDIFWTILADDERLG
jgi:hypothetical protein